MLMGGVELQDSLKEMVVRVLLLEGVKPAEIGTDETLFGGSLGLDSVDALELAIHIEEEFKVRMPEGEGAREAWRSVGTIASYIEARRTA